MKKIKSMRQLQAEKKRLREERTALENAMQADLQVLKSFLHPADEKKNTGEAEKPESIFSRTFRYGVNLLAGQVAGKAEEKLSNIFRRKRKV